MSASISAIVLLAIVFMVAGFVSADDRPAVMVSGEGLNPRRLEVHVGEVVRWVGPAGRPLRIVLDAHPDAHEVVVERVGEVRAVFRASGEHWYGAAWTGGPPNGLSGVVAVRPAVGAPLLPPTCSPESSARVCIEP